MAPWNTDTLRAALTDVDRLVRRLALSPNTTYCDVLVDDALKAIRKEQGLKFGDEPDERDLVEQVSAGLRLVERQLLERLQVLEGAPR